MLCASRPIPCINDAVWEGAVELGFALPRLVRNIRYRCERKCAEMEALGHLERPRHQTNTDGHGSLTASFVLVPSIFPHVPS